MIRTARPLALASVIASTALPSGNTPNRSRVTPPELAPCLNSTSSPPARTALPIRAIYMIIAATRPGTQTRRAGPSRMERSCNSWSASCRSLLWRSRPRRRPRRRGPCSSRCSKPTLPIRSSFPTARVPRLFDQSHAAAAPMCRWRSRRPRPWEILRSGRQAARRPSRPARLGAGRLTWAPEVLKTGNGFVLYFTARTGKSGRQCIGAATATDAAGPFVRSRRAARLPAPARRLDRSRRLPRRRRQSLSLFQERRESVRNPATPSRPAPRAGRARRRRRTRDWRAATCRAGRQHVIEAPSMTRLGNLRPVLLRRPLSAGRTRTTCPLCDRLCDLPVAHRPLHRCAGKSDPAQLRRATGLPQRPRPSGGLPLAAVTSLSFHAWAATPAATRSTSRALPLCRAARVAGRHARDRRQPEARSGPALDCSYAGVRSPPPLRGRVGEGVSSVRD